MKTTCDRVLCLTALALLLAGASPCPAGPPVIGDEFPIASVSVQTPQSQKNVSFAAYPGGYLAVWGDTRSSSSDVYGMFVDANCQPTGSDSFLISRTSRGEPLIGDQRTPSVAFNGTDFLVVWVDVPQGSTIWGARVSTAGVVLDPGGILVSLATDVCEGPRVASNGVDWEAVWQRTSTGLPDIGGARISAAGAVSSKITVSGLASNETQPDIAWNGLSGTSAQYLVVWVDGGQELTDDIYACRIDRNGAKVAGSTILISSTSASSTTRQSGDQNYPSVAGSATGAYMVVWDDDRDGIANTDVYCARVTSAGALQDRGGIQVYSDVGQWGEFYRSTPRIAWNGSHYLVAIRDVNDSRKVYGRRVGTDGVVGATAYQYSSFPAGQSGLAAAGKWGGGGWAVGWDSAGLQGDIYGCSVASGGTGGTTYLISLSVQDQQGAAAVFTGTHHVVLWADRRDGIYQIYAARCLPNGTVVDTTGVRIAASSNDQTEPAAAWDSTNSRMLVVWSEKTSAGGEPDIKGILLRGDLTAYSSQLTLTSADFAQQTPAVAWNGTHYLCAWKDNRVDGATYNIYAVRVTATGGILSSISICTADLDQTEPCVAAGPSGTWLVAWSDMRSGLSNIYCRPVTSGGTAQTEQIVSSAVSSKAAPAIASNGTFFLAAWADAGATFAIRAARLNSSGTRYVSGEPDIVIASLTGSRTEPWVSWNSEKFVVSWQDDRNFSTNGSDVYLARVSTAGVVEDANGAVVSSSAASELGPVTSASSASYSGAFYVNLTASIDRLRGRICLLGDPPPIPVSIEAARQQAEDTNVSISGAVVTAGNDQLTGRFYVEDRSRIVGIKVAWSGTTIQEGNVITAVGKVQTVNGERQITATSVTVTNPSGVVPNPFKLPCCDMGGVAAGLVPGVTGGQGPNNIGLLVTICGRVKNPGGGVFYIEDYTRRVDGLPPVQKVICPYTLPGANTYCSVTGISSCQQDGSNLTSVLLMRKQSDLIQHN